MPADTLVMSGDHSALSDGGAIDVSGWDLSLIEVAPPPAFSGTLEWGVRVTPPEDSGRPVSVSETFTLQVNDAEGGLTPSDDAPPDLMSFDLAVDTGWAEDVPDKGHDSDTAEASGAEESDVLSEEVALLPDAEISAELHDAPDRQDW